MNAPTQPDSPLRHALLDQIAAITTMQPGTLAEEYREHPDPSGQGVVRRGPYFKYQLWQDGHNLSRRVPAEEAATLKLDLDNAKRFHQLTAQLAQLNIEHTLALRGTEAAAAHAIAEKKTSKPNASPKNTAKRNTSSPKPARSSPTGKNSKT
jgi:hypothetical protein